MIDASYYAILPPYIRIYIKSLSSASESARDAATWDLKTFLDYLKDTFHFEELDQIPVSVFLSLTSDDIHLYIDYLNDRHRKNQTVHRKLWSLSRFYAYLVEGGLLSCSPVTDVRTDPLNYQSPEPLTDRQIEILLNGVERNDLMGIQGDDGKFHIYPINYLTKIRRERFVSRNHAILSLLLKTGLTAKEVAAINQDDLSEHCTKLTLASGEALLLSDDVASSLKRYLHGGGNPDFIWKKYPDSANMILSLCEQYMDSEKLFDKFHQQFGEVNEDFAKDIEKAAQCMRRGGRNALFPKVPDALFLSLRGTRLSVRQMEKMVLQMSHTYLGTGLTPIRMSISARKRSSKET